MGNEEREVNKTMLGDVEWLHRQLKKMGRGFNHQHVAQYVGRSVDFVKGILWERERAASEKANKLVE